MKTETEASVAGSRALDWVSLNSEIKSRAANLRGTPYRGDVRIDWDSSDGEMAAAITAGLTFGTDGGDREGFLTRLLTARLTAEGEIRALLFGSAAEKVQPYSIQMVAAEQSGQPHLVKALVWGAKLRCLVTISNVGWNALHPWTRVIDRVFQSCPAAGDFGLLPPSLR